MNNHDLLLHVNPFHLELLRPLVKWKILSIKELFEDGNYQGGYKGFHKIVSKLERHEVIKGFKDCWTNSKRVYLSKKGNELVNPWQWRADAFNDSTLFHDSRVSLYLRYLHTQIKLDGFALDQERMRHFKNGYDAPKIRPDADFSLKGNNKKSIPFFLEIELTQKSLERIREKLSNYLEDRNGPRVLFVFPSESIAKSYLAVLRIVEGTNRYDRIVIAIDQGLIRGNFSLERSRVLQEHGELTLLNYFMAITERSDGDSLVKLGRVWRSAIETVW